MPMCIYMEIFAQSDRMLWHPCLLARSISRWHAGVVHKQKLERFVGERATSLNSGTCAFRLEVTFQKVLEGTFEIYFYNGNQDPGRLKWLTHVCGRTRSLHFLLCARKINSIFQSASSVYRLCKQLLPLLRPCPHSGMLLSLCSGCQQWGSLNKVGLQNGAS